MARKRSITYTTGVVLQAISQGYIYGFDIMDVSGLPDGTVYPALRRLEEAGCLVSQWEDQKRAVDQKRPPRRYYDLTADGETLLKEARERFPGLGSAVLGSRQPREAI